MCRAYFDQIGEMAPSKKGPMCSFCTVCKVDFSISGGGVHEVKRHSNSAKHKNALLGVSTQPRISSVMAMVSESEVLGSFARFAAEHNLPFTIADHFTRLCKVMFPDSKVADSFSCAHVKTSVVITHALAPNLEEAVVSACRHQPFSILCDGGNDNFQKKYFSILARQWDQCQHKVVVRFLDCPICNWRNTVPGTGRNFAVTLHSMAECHWLCF